MLTEIYQALAGRSVAAFSTLIRGWIGVKRDRRFVADGGVPEWIYRRQSRPALADYLRFRTILTEIYIEALLVDKELADQVWEDWDKARLTIRWRIWRGGL